MSIISKHKILAVLGLSLFFSLLASSAIIFLYPEHLLFGEIGDYYFDVDPTFIFMLDGNIFNMYGSATTPLMMPASIFVRFIGILLYSLLDNQILLRGEYPVRLRYIVGTYSVFFVAFVFIFVAILTTFKDKVFNTKPKLLKKVFYFITLLAAFIINPLIIASSYWGHPEEFLMAGLILSSCLFLLNKNYFLMSITAGLAIATKQPAVFLLPALFFALPPQQKIKYSGLTIFFFIVFAFPFIIPDFVAFFKHNFLLAGSQDFSAFKGIDFFSAAQSLSILGKPLILFIAIFLPSYIAYKNKHRKLTNNLLITNTQFSIIVPLIFLLRSLLDAGNISYYALPVGLTLFLIDYLVFENRFNIKNKKIQKLYSFFDFPAPICLFAGSCYIWLFLSTPIFFPQVSILIRFFVTIIAFSPFIIIALYYSGFYEYIKTLSRKSFYIFITGILALAFLGNFIQKSNNTDSTNSRFPYTSKTNIVGIRNITPDGLLSYHLPVLDSKEGINASYSINNMITSITSQFYDKRKVISLVEYAKGDKSLLITTHGKYKNFNKIDFCNSDSKCKKTQTPPGFISSYLLQNKTETRYYWDLFLINNQKQLITINNYGMPYDYKAVIKNLKSINR